MNTVQRSLRTIGCAIVVAVAFAPANGQEVIAGLDHWTTVSPVTLPLDGVGPIDFCGAPISPTLGSTDTIVQRSGSLDLGSGPSTVPIELVALSLTSCQPITADFGGGAMPWDVKATVLPGASGGSMTIRKTHANGGTFDSQFFVRPTFLFTQVGNPIVTHVIDTQTFTFFSLGRPWSCIPESNMLLVPGPDPDPNANFHVGAPANHWDFFPPGTVPFAGSAAWNMHLTVVPEPSALAGLVLAIGILIRRKR
ncbi:MAG: PEP-CTERM sorting domain-containing protein [Armatimonadetes bacterium]|nr:PEP-CTERM sorting domain-containing protein [Armatimonadota bacterium]